jgi:hypothetical protein
MMTDQSAGQVQFTDAAGHAWTFEVFTSSAILSRTTLAEGGGGTYTEAYTFVGPDADGYYDLAEQDLTVTASGVPTFTATTSYHVTPIQTSAPGGAPPGRVVEASIGAFLMRFQAPVNYPGCTDATWNMWNAGINAMTAIVTMYAARNAVTVLAAATAATNFNIAVNNYLYCIGFLRAPAHPHIGPCGSCSIQ